MSAESADLPVEERAAPDGLVLLHTSDATGVVGVAHEGRVTGDVLDSQGRHAGSLLGALQRVLRGAEVDLGVLSGVVVTVGPGSFTGIRIGLATAQGLAAARGWSVWTSDSLRVEAAAAAANASTTDGIAADAPLAVAQDARRSEVYAALYELGATAPVARRPPVRADDTTHGTPLPRELVAPFCAAAAEAGSRMRAAAASRPFAIVGSGAALVAEAAASGSSIVVRKPPERLALLTALAAMARAGACTRIEPHQLEPTYLRKSDAEIKREWSA